MKRLFIFSAFMLMVMTSTCLLQSCSKDSDNNGGIDTTPISLLSGKETTIQGADTISSSNKFIAYGKGNKVYAWHVGKATLLVNGEKSIPITVQPQYKMMEDPICEWGCSQDYVKKHQNQGTYNYKSDDKYLLYESAGAADVLGYTFESGKLSSVVVLISTSYTSSYMDYLLERFLMLPYQKDDDVYFIGADGLDLSSANSVVILQVYSSKYIANVYMPADKYATRSISNDIAMQNDAIKIVEECIQKNEQK